MNRPDFFRRPPSLWVLLLLCALLWGGEYSRRGLWEPDEARYAAVAQEMRTNAPYWLVPHLQGQPYPDKPPLMFWLINGFSLLTGRTITGISARLPSLLGTVMSLWAVTRLMARWHSVQAAWRSLFVLLTTFLFWQKTGWGQIDALLCGLILMSVWCFDTALEMDRRTWQWGAFLFAGLGILAKGPPGLVLPFGITITGALWNGNRAGLKRLHWIWGTVLALSIPGAWLLAAWLQHPPPEYFGAMMGEKTFGRVVAGGHTQPFYYFLWHFPLENLPWTLFLPAMWIALGNTPLRRKLTGWILFVIGFFSLLSCKRNLYILPAYPAAAMMIGAGWDRFQDMSLRWHRIPGIFLTVLIWIAAAAAATAAFLPIPEIAPKSLIPTALVLIAGGILLTRLRREPRLNDRWLLTFCGILMAVQATATTFVMPTLNDRKGPTEIVPAIRQLLPPGQTFYLYREQLAILSLYVQRPGRELSEWKDLQAVCNSPSGTVVTMSTHYWEELRPELPPPDRIEEYKVGHKHMVLLHFKPGPGS